MAIYTQEEVQLQQGHVKTIDEAGIMMVFDTLQKYQYSFPIKSTVRELLSNGLDSVSEKNVAKKILSGKARVEDFYVDIEGAIYKDSKFDPDYYDLRWLSDDDEVQIEYFDQGNIGRDFVMFKDYGVGLGGKRLEGYFKLAYSTKRLSKLPLGKFGLGAKAPISITQPYTMESRYNGRLFRFNIYSQKVDSIIPRLNLETGAENPHVLFSEGTEHQYPVYYLPTKEKNGVTITIDAKKHHKSQYVDAVKSQMLYFDNIRATLNNGGVKENVEYRAKILYEDDMIVMSDNQYFSKPHLLLNKVNYGYIAWDELELEDKKGNIGIKVAPEDVEVNPSRESVLWTEKTKEKVLARFNEVVDIAAGMIQEELNATDYFDWLDTCYAVYSRYSERGGVVGRLAKIVDMTKAKFKFNPNPLITFDPKHPFPGLSITYVKLTVDHLKTGGTKKYIRRERMDYYGGLQQRQIYIMKKDGRALNRKDKWLCSIHEGAFLVVKEPVVTMAEAERLGWGEAQIKIMHEAASPIRMAYWEAISSSNRVLVYEDVEVPEDFKATDEEFDLEEFKKEEATKEEIAKVQTARQSEEQRRKAQGKILVTLYSSHWAGQAYDNDEQGNRKLLTSPFNNMKFEIPVSSINNWDQPEVYYGTEADDKLMRLAMMFTRDPRHDPKKGSVRSHAADVATWQRMKWWRTHQDLIRDCKIPETQMYHMPTFFDTDVAYVKVSQGNLKYFRDFSPIQEFFITIRNKTITMSNTLIKWNTARLVRDQLEHVAFLWNYPFYPKYCNGYRKLCAYVDKNYREVEEHRDNTYGLSDQVYTDMITHLDNVHEFQKFVAQAPNDHVNIGKLAQKMFGNKDLQQGMAVEPEVMELLSEVLEYGRTVGSVLNHIPAFTGYREGVKRYSGSTPRLNNRDEMDETLERDIRMYLEMKGALEPVDEPKVEPVLVEHNEYEKEILDVMHS